VKIAVVIPCYRVANQILAVIENIGPEIDSIFVVDDACPERAGRLVDEQCHDERVKIIYHEENRGVGGAMVSGYEAALKAGAEIVVKLDGDGQMNPGLIPAFVAPIKSGDADYVKGNRFFNLEAVQSMPRVRLAGNAALSFLAKLSTGYWKRFDPTNGYTAIHSTALKHLPLKKIDHRYFFESDMLFRLNTIGAMVVDVPMDAVYGEEQSSLCVLKSIPEFLYKHIRNLFKRIFYNYFLRDFNIASLELLFGVAFISFGGFFGFYQWSGSIETGLPVTSGTVMLAALPLLLGNQLILSFLNYDIASIPRISLQKRIRNCSYGTPPSI
jgi:dolichol-phosphate mannosyltransferase